MSPLGVDTKRGWVAGRVEGMRAQLCAEAAAASVSGQTGPPRGYSEDTGVSWTGYTIGCEKKVPF